LIRFVRGGKPQRGRGIELKIDYIIIISAETAKGSKSRIEHRPQHQGSSGIGGIIGIQIQIYPMNIQTEKNRSRNTKSAFFHLFVTMAPHPRALPRSQLMLNTPGIIVSR
jgi:hypothetical protein